VNEHYRDFIYSALNKTNENKRYFFSLDKKFIFIMASICDYDNLMVVGNLYKCSSGYSCLYTPDQSYSNYLRIYTKKYFMFSGKGVSFSVPGNELLMFIGRKQFLYKNKIVQPETNFIFEEII
jgi:hypothetical protein